MEGPKGIEEGTAAKQRILEHGSRGGSGCQLLHNPSSEEGLPRARWADERQALALTLAGHRGKRTRTELEYMRRKLPAMGMQMALKLLARK